MDSAHQPIKRYTKSLGQSGRHFVSNPAPATQDVTQMARRAANLGGDLGHVEVWPDGVPSAARGLVLVWSSTHKQVNYGME